MSCPRVKTFGAVWVWCGITVCTLLIQVVITSYDLVLLETDPDSVYSGSLANSLMYTACQALYMSGVVAFAVTEPPPPRRLEPPEAILLPPPPRSTLRFWMMMAGWCISTLQIEIGYDPANYVSGVLFLFISGLVLRLVALAFFSLRMKA